jgi:transcriptional regulator of arginine metabolism
VANQHDLVELLGQHGYAVTQATVSRDLAAVGAVKEVGPAGERYVLGAVGEEGPETEALRRLLGDFAVSIVASGSLVLVKTDEGAAPAVGRALDRAALRGVLGTVAGDDTLLVVADEAVGGKALAETLNQILEGR